MGNSQETDKSYQYTMTLYIFIYEYYDPSPFIAQHSKTQSSVTKSVCHCHAPSTICGTIFQPNLTRATPDVRNWNSLNSGFSFTSELVRNKNWLRLRVQSNELFV